MTKQYTRDDVATMYQDGSINEEERDKKLKEIDEREAIEKDEDAENKYEPVSIITPDMTDAGLFTYEQVYSDNINRFVYFDGEKFCYTNAIDNGYEEKNGKRVHKWYVPIVDDGAIKQKAVILADKPEPFESTEQLVNEIKEHIHRYLDVSPEYEQFMAWYILMTWVYDNLNTIPYLRALGDSGTGKSRLLKVCKLCYRPSFVAGSVTPAPIYRLIDKWHGTILLDEADFSNSNEKNEVIKILNCGFEKDNSVMRCNTTNPDILEFFPTFCPKVLATRKTFADTALESRCLTERMKQTNRKDIPTQLTDQFEEEQKALRNKLLYFRLMFKDKVNKNDVHSVDFGANIEPRLKQATASFAILFMNIPELMKQFRAFIAKYQAELVEERAGTQEGMVVNACEVLRSSESSKSCHGERIAEKVREMYGYEISSRVVGKILKNTLGLRTEKVAYIKDGKETSRRVIADDEDNLAVWNTVKERYIPTDTVYNNNNMDIPSHSHDFLDRHDRKDDNSLLSIDDTNSKPSDSQTKEPTSILNPAKDEQPDDSHGKEDLSSWIRKMLPPSPPRNNPPQTKDGPELHSTRKFKILSKIEALGEAHEDDIRNDFDTDEHHHIQPLLEHMVRHRIITVTKEDKHGKKYYTAM